MQPVRRWPDIASPPPAGPVRSHRRRPSRRVGLLASFGLIALAALTGCLPWAQATPEASHAAHWAYTGSDGPSHWGELSPDYNLCNTGKDQSPVDLQPVRLMKADWLLPLQVSLKPTKLAIVNNGHTIQVNYDKGSKFSFDRTEYELKQFHFHAPSEHTFDGVAADMETHLVFSTPGKRLAVIGILMVVGAENPFFAKFWDSLPAKENEAITRELDLNVGDLLPTNRDYFHYDGSLTTPPCSEGVKWIVLRQSVTISASQVNRFKAIFPVTSRPTQPLGERIVKESVLPPVR